MSEQPWYKESKSIAGFKINNLLLVIILVGSIVGGILGTLYGTGFFQEIYQDRDRPPAPPVEFSTGYAVILGYNNHNGTEIANSSIDVHYYDYNNESYISSSKAGVKVKINVTTLAVVEINDYWNKTIAVYARNDVNDPYINEFFFTLKCPTNKIDFSMVYLNGTYNNWSPNNISIGMNTIYFQAKLNTSYQGNHSYASGWYVPNSTRLANQTYYNMSVAQTWIGFEGNLSSIEINGIIFPTYLIGNITVTAYPTVYTDAITYCTLNATTPIDKIWLFSGQLDDFNGGIYLNSTGGLIV